MGFTLNTGSRCSLSLLLACNSTGLLVQICRQFCVWDRAFGTIGLCWPWYRNRFLFYCSWTRLPLANLALELALQWYSSFTDFCGWLDKQWTSSKLLQTGPHRLTWWPPQWGNPGPKSGHSRGSRINKFLLRYLLISFIMANFLWNGGEGCGRTMTAAGTSSSMGILHPDNGGVKFHGPRPEASFGPITWPHGGTKVVKRSIKRAYRRAQLHGVSWYRGRCLQPQDFQFSAQTLPKQQAGPQPSLQHQQRCGRGGNDSHQSKRHLKFLQWNSSGLSNARLDELKCWLHPQNLDVVVILETHWRFTGEWSDTDWNFIHSGAPGSSGAGILLMISKRIAKMQDLQWNEVQPGRLVHARLGFSSRHVDLLACYQHANTSGQRRLEHRRSWWSLFDSYLTNLPRRNVLMALGDFNCSLEACGSHVGTTNFRTDRGLLPGAQHADAGQFLSIVRAHGLVALNSFCPTLGPTFQHGSNCSRIDYFFTRITTADVCAKNVKYLHDLPFLGPKKYGHVPMICQLKRYWIPPNADSGSTGISAQQRKQGRDACFLNTDQWSHFLFESAQNMTAYLNNAEPSDLDFIVKLHAIAGDAFNRSFPAGHGLHTTPHWISNRSIILDKWRHRESCKHITVVTPSNVLHAWMHITRFQVLKRLHKRFAWQVRQSQFHQILDEAQHAACCNDSHKLFQTISKFCPKQPRRRVQLRNRLGSIASPVEELAILSAFVQKIWQGPDQLPMPILDDDAMPFTEQDLLRALRNIPATKAVAKPFVAGFVWKSQASVITPFLYRALCTWWSAGAAFLPQCWKDAWMMLIPKPGKAPVVPESLRPLALQEPIGKAVIGVLAQKAQSQSQSCFASLPFWAYLPCRSTQHALQRVAIHCRAARALVSSQKPTAFHRYQNLPSFKVCGAIQLFVDLQRAFDCISRVDLFSRLCDVGVNTRIAQLLASWHCQTHYHVAVGGHSHALPVGSGVRQGCKAAPWLFNAFLALYMQDLEAHIDMTWLRDHLDLYADDFRVGCLFHSEYELKMVLRKFGILLEQLQQHGLTVNTAKSAILLTMAGTSYRDVRARLVTQTADGQWIKILGTQGQLFQIPLVKKLKYLGCIVSYDRMETDTLKHRLSLMKIAFDRLRKWLTAKHGLTLPTRMRLWQTCVVPVLTYGIFVIGLTPADLQRVQVTMFTMIRQILHNHSYRTGMTHNAVLSHWNLLHPLVLLWQAADSLFQSVTQCLPGLRSDDVAKTIDWTGLAEVRDMIWDHYLTGLNVPGTASLPVAQADDIITCEICGFLCQHVSALRRHYTQTHKITPHLTFVPNPADHMINGLPQCKHCFQSFTTWRSFMAHIQRSCQVLHRQLPPDQLPTGLNPDRHFADMSNPDAAVRSCTMLTDQELAFFRSLEFGPRLQTLLQNRQWQQILRDKAACQYMAHKCIFCGQFVGRAHAMHLNMRTAHPMDHDAIHTKATQLTNYAL